MSDDLVERVAKAIYEAWCAFHGVTKTSMPWDEVWGEERQACLAEARAAIAVVLEEAADAVGEVGDHAEVGAYINAIRALKEEK